MRAEPGTTTCSRGCAARRTDPVQPTRIVDHRRNRTWSENAVRLIEADGRRSADTHLHRLALPDWSRWTDDAGRDTGIELYLKDESTHPTGSLKHRLARSLFLYAICNGWVTEGTTVIEASSGSTAVSEAYFAKLIGVPFIAVMASSTSPAKTALIEREGGRCHFVDRPGDVYAEALRLEAERGGHFIDQFTMAERATDWRGNNNIAESIFAQMAEEDHPIPTWIVVGAGTGGTSATLGRYVRYRRHPTWLAVVDPQNSVFLPAYDTGDGALRSELGSRIEGIGRPRVEPSFVSQVIDRMIGVPDNASIATARLFSDRLGRRVGGSTGTNLWGALQIVAEMAAQRQPGSVVTLLCDSGDRYANTYFDDDWLSRQGFDLTEPTAVLDEFLASGHWTGATA